MKVSFLGFDGNQQKTAYQAEVHIQNGIFCFEDKTYPNTMIYLTKDTDRILLERKGSCNMQMCFILDKITEGHYQNQEGIEFNYFVKTKLLKIEKTKIRISYEMIIEEEVVSIQSLQFSFFNS